MLENPFSYAAEEKQQVRCYWRRVGFSIFAAIALALILVPLLTGCATTDEPKVCYLGLMGQTEQGMVVVMQHCMSQEQFKAAQQK